MARLEVICDTYLSVSTPVQIAAPALLEHGRAIRAAIADRITRNLAALRAEVARVPSVTLLEPEGGWSAVLRVPAVPGEEAIVLTTAAGRSRRGASWILLRFFRGGVPGREPAARRGDVRRWREARAATRGGRHALMARHAGLMLPLFSATATTSWGIGELPDIVPLAQWMGAAGFSRLMLLPIGTMPDGETSPYSAVSAMAIDPIYIAPAALEDFHRAGGVEALPADTRALLDAARHARTVPYPIVRRLKHDALDLAFGRFFADEWGQLSLRASALAAYIARERWWLDDYALYQAIAGLTAHPAWRAWTAPLRDRDPAALDEARRRLSREILRQQYVQWIAESQWQTARAGAHAAGVTLIGDLPFMVAADSADVWVRPGEFRLDVSLGVPPDAFSATGQDWGMPTYNWPAIEQSGYAWLQQRARRMAALFDGYRVDHLVGLYRTFGRPAAGAPFFTPSDEPSQVRQGERILRDPRELGRRDHRRGSRRRARFRPRVARSPERARLQSAALGTRGGRCPATRSWTRRSIPPCRPR